MKNNIQIKFRAWDKILKMMLYWDEIENNELKTWLSYWKLFIAIQKRNWDWDELKIMQYTWLKDKNWKEIYFWDILATSNSNRDYDIWDKEEYGYTTVLERKDELWVTFSNWHPVSEYEEDIYSMNFVEIIWNIYETPYLLKE